MPDSNTSRFIGYRILEFSPAVEDALRQIAECLMPYEGAILDSWIDHQWNSWQPPGLSQQDLRETFRGILAIILHGMYAREPENCLGELEQVAGELASRAFPYEALIISVHFLEQSYLPHLLGEQSRQLPEWLTGMDQFMHAVLASMATAYFEVNRRELLDRVEIGRLVQECLLADIPRSVQDMEVGYVYESAQEQARLGGDFLDSFVTPAGKLTFIVGDLSGHGLPAVADAIMIRSLFKGFMFENMRLEDAVTRLNRVLSYQLATDHFATAVALTYDSTGRLEIVNAGHPPPVICGDGCASFEPHDIALGVREDVVYSANTTEVRPGELMVIYTDGLIEARKGKEFFGARRLMAGIEATRDAPARVMAEHLLDTGLRFAGGKLADDVAVLVLKRRG